MITNAQFPDLVKNAKVSWKRGYDAVPSRASALYDVYTVDEKTSEHSSMTGDTFAKRKDEGDKYTEGNVVQGYTTIFSQLRIGLTKSLTYEMRKFDKYMEIDRLMYGLGKTCKNRLELDLTHQFTFAFAGTYVNLDGEVVSATTGDGLPICDTAHTLTGSAKTFSNKITAKFSRAALEEAEELFTDRLDNLGNKIVITPDTIVTSDDPTTVNLVKEFLKSTEQVDGNNNNVNVYHKKYTHIVLPYLATDGNGGIDPTKKNQWFLLDAQETSALCEVSDTPRLIAPRVDSNSEEFSTDDLAFKTNAMYDLGVTCPRFVVGSDGTTV